jgi:hypothetical protein
MILILTTSANNSIIYINILGVVLVRSAPATFHIVDVDDFTSMLYF